MKRGAPMKRTVFARRPPRIDIGSATRILRPIRQVAPFTLTAPVQTPKHEYIRSPALMKAYRLLPCQHCGISDGTVCGAHSNWAPHHKGGSIKADDNRAASLCSWCHYMVDQGNAWSYEQKRSNWVNAHAKTVTQLVLRGLWPKDVPVPETAELLKEWSLPCWW
jgi:hypothetical protein